MITITSVSRLRGVSDRSRHRYPALGLTAIIRRVTTFAALAPPENPGVGISSLIRRPRIRAAVALSGLAVSAWTCVANVGPHPGPIIAVAIAAAVVAWIALIFLGRGRAAVVAIVILGAAGGVAGVGGQAGFIFSGVASSTAAGAYDTMIALALTVPGPLAFVLTAASTRGVSVSVLEAITCTLVGLVAGGSRRAITHRTAAAAELAIERQHTEVARMEAELAAERNRLAREVHDVLAHTLGALSIQFTAIDTLARKNTDQDRLLAQIEQGRDLLSAGLDEARQAVHALREDRTPLIGQLERLSELHKAPLTIEGTARRLEPTVTLVLYRLVQEALTNAAKHAPGATATIDVAFTTDQVTVAVRNTDPPARPRPLHDAGGGYGLRGMSERVTQAGGTCHAGPTADGGWLVTAQIAT